MGGLWHKRTKGGRDYFSEIFLLFKMFQFSTMTQKHLIAVRKSRSSLLPELILVWHFTLQPLDERLWAKPICHVMYQVLTICINSHKMKSIHASTNHLYLFPSKSQLLSLPSTVICCSLNVIATLTETTLFVLNKNQQLVLSLEKGA